MLVRKHSSYFDHLDSRPVQVVHIPSIPQGRDGLLTSLVQILIQLTLIPSGINFRALSLARYWTLSILRRRKDSERNSHLFGWYLLIVVGRRVCSLGALWLAAGTRLRTRITNLSKDHQTWASSNRAIRVRTRGVSDCCGSVDIPACGQSVEVGQP